MDTLKLGCAVLTAGNTRRSTRLSLRQRSVILQALASIPAEEFDAIVVVTPYPEIMRLAKEFHFAAVCNDHPEQGVGWAVSLGLTGLRDCDGVMFLGGGGTLPPPRREQITDALRKWRASPRDASSGPQASIFPAWFFHQLFQEASSTIPETLRRPVTAAEAPSQPLKPPGGR